MKATAWYKGITCDKCIMNLQELSRWKYHQEHWESVRKLRFLDLIAGLVERRDEKIGKRTLLFYAQRLEGFVLEVDGKYSSIFSRLGGKPCVAGHFSCCYLPNCSHAIEYLENKWVKEVFRILTDYDEKIMYLTVKTGFYC
jgi:hypothetical protein